MDNLQHLQLCYSDSPALVLVMVLKVLRFVLTAVPPMITTFNSVNSVTKIYSKNEDFRDLYKRGSAQHSSTVATKESANMTDLNCRDQLTQYFDLQLLPQIKIVIH